MANAEKNTGIEVNANAIENVKGSNQNKKRKAVPPMWRVLGKARKVFDVQLQKTNAVKLQCIRNFMTAEISDTDKFWSDYMEQVGKLLDSRKYTMECERLDCPADNVAEHIVFLGSASINKILKNGVHNTIGNDVYLYKERFTPQESDIYQSAVTAFMDKVDRID